MVKSRGVEAYLVRYDDNVRYAEHDYPATAQEAMSTSTEVYVEAVEDERYALFVVLTPEFDFRRSPEVKIRWKLDNSARRTVLTTKEIRASFRSEGHYKYKVDAIPVQMGGRWKLCGLNFNGLHIGTSTSGTNVRLLIPRLT